MYRINMCDFYLMGAGVGHRFPAAEWLGFSVSGDQNSTVDLHSGSEGAVLSAFQESVPSHCGLLIDISRCE